MPILVWPERAIFIARTQQRHGLRIGYPTRTTHLACEVLRLKPPTAFTRIR